MTRPTSRLLAAIAVGLALAGPAAAQQTSELFAGFQTKSRDPVHVDAKSLEIYEENKVRISVFSGDVTVTRGKTTLKAGTIKLFSDPTAKTAKSESFSRIEASGSVYVTSGEQTVTGARAVVDMKGQTITLSGKVVLTQGKSVLTGERLVVDLRTGRAKLEQAPGGRIQGVFSPDDAKGLQSQ
jgi:lipopolysaccharide export system protein LptA